MGPAAFPKPEPRNPKPGFVGRGVWDVRGWWGKNIFKRSGNGLETSGIHFIKPGYSNPLPDPFSLSYLGRADVVSGSIERMREWVLKLGFDC